MAIRDITWEIIDPSENTVLALRAVTDENGGVLADKQEILWNPELETNVTAVPQENFAILKATLHKQFSDDGNGWGDYDLCAYLPIPIRKSRNYQYISGTTNVVYNSFGELDRTNF